MGSFCGTESQTVIQNNTNPNVTAQQNWIYGAVNNIVDQYKTNPSALVAPWNSIQTAATQGIADQATANLPWNYLGQGLVGQGAEMASTAPSFYNAALTQLGQATPITGQAWNPTPYESPYTQDVIDTTMANINRNNAIQQNGALGNAIAQGNAFGGDRAGIAMSELARNQALASNQTMAQLQQADFNQASQQANAQQQYGLNLGLAQNAQNLQQANALSGLGNNMTQAGLAQGNLGAQTGALGNQGQSGALSGLGALYNAGANLQTTQQQQLSAPLTLAQWMASNSPGTSATPTSTTYPGSSPAATIAGLGLAGLGGASLLSSLAPLALFEHGGRVNKQGGGAIGGDSDIVSRFRRMQKALQDGGAVSVNPENPETAGQVSENIWDNYNRSRKSATTQAFDLDRRTAAEENLATASQPYLQQLARGMLLLKAPTPGYQAGGDVDPMVGGVDPVTGLPRKTKAALGIGSLGLNMLDPKGPTHAPHAPGQSSLPDLGMLGALGRQGGGGVPVDDNDPGNSDVDAPPLSRMNAGLGDLVTPDGRYVGPTDRTKSPNYADNGPPPGFQPRYNIAQFMDRDAAKKSLAMAMIAAGARMAAQRRDKFGLRASPLGEIAEGLGEGVGFLSKSDEDQRKAALQAMQLQAQWEQHQAQMKMETDKALGIISGQPTLQGRSTALAEAKGPIENAHLRAETAKASNVPVAPGANLVNINPEAGRVGDIVASQPLKPPPGYEPDPTNPGGYRPQIGGPADIKFTEAKNKALFGVESSVRKMDDLVQNITELQKHPGLSGNFGIYGKLPNIPGGSSADAWAKLEQLKAQGGFAMLQAMRDASKTGGALGNVSDAEGARLEAAFGALQRSTSIDQAMKELAKIKQQTMQARGMVINAYDRQYNASNIPGQTPTKSAPEGAGRAIIPPPQEEGAGKPIKEGTTAINKETGQRIIMRDGKWQPIQ